MQTELRVKFLMLRCPEKGNAKDFLRGLQLKKEELAQVGVRISDEDYISTIISSLPDVLSSFASSQMAWTMQQMSKLINASTLMTMLLQEVDWQYLRTQRCKQRSGKGKDEEKDKVLAVDQSKRKKERDYSLINCWNCRDKGHFRSKCPKQKKVPGESKKPAENSSDSKIDSGPKTVSAVKKYPTRKGLGWCMRWIKSLATKTGLKK